MAAGQGTVTIKILGDAQDALRSLAGVEGGLAKVEGKLGSLGKAFGATGALMAGGLAAGGVALFKIGESFDEQYDKIRTGTGFIGGELDDLKQTFKDVVADVPTDFGRAGDAVTAITQKLGFVGDTTKPLAEQFLELSRITKTDLTENLNSGLGALNNWGISSDRMGPVLDQMFRATQLTGTSFATLANGMSSSGLQLRALGFEFGDAIALTAKLGQVGLDVSDILPALSKTMAHAAKEGKDAGTVFQETFDKIKNAPSDTAAAGVALDVFGAKAGPKLAELIREGKFEYTDLLKNIQQGSDTIIGAAKDTQDFGEKWELFKNRILVALEPIAMRVFDGIGEAMDRLPAIMARLNPYFEKFRDVVQQVGEKLVVFGVWLADHQPILEGIAVAVGVGLVAAFYAWAASAAAAAAATIAAMAPVIAIGAAIAAVTAAIIYAYQNWDWFRATVDAVASFLIDTAWPAMQSFFAAIVTAVTWVVDVFNTAWPYIADTASTVWGVLRAAWDNVGRPIFDVFAEITSAIVSFFQTMWPGVQEAFSTTLDVINTVWANVGKPVLDSFETAFDAVRSAVDFVVESIQTLIGWIKKIPNPGSALGGIPGIGSLGGALGLPGFDSGGLVDQVPKGQPMLAVLHGGEYVVPADQVGGAQSGAGGGYSPTYEINVNGANMTADELIAAIKRYEQRNGSSWRN